MRLCYFR